MEMSADAPAFSVMTISSTWATTNSTTKRVRAQRAVFVDCSRTARRHLVQRRGSSPAGEVVTLSQVPGARDKAERAERAVFAHLNMTPARLPSAPTPKHCRAASARGARPGEERIRQRLEKGVDAGSIASNPRRRASWTTLARSRSAKTAVAARQFSGRESRSTRSPVRRIDHARADLLGWIYGSDCPPGGRVFHPPSRTPLARVTLCLPQQSQSCLHRRASASCRS